MKRSRSVKKTIYAATVCERTPRGERRGRCATAEAGSRATAIRAAAATLKRSIRK